MQPPGVIMCTLLLVLCVGVASSARIYDSEGRPVEGNYGAVDYSREGRQLQYTRGPGDGPIDADRNQARPADGRYGEADRVRIPDRPPSGPQGGAPPPPEGRGFGDRSNEIADEITAIYFDNPTEQRPLYADTYKHYQNDYHQRSEEDEEHRRAGGDRSGAIDCNLRIEDAGNPLRGNGARGASGDKNTQRAADAEHTSRGARNEDGVKDAPTERPVAGSVTGRGGGQRSTGAGGGGETSTTAASTPPDLDNRDSFAGANCPSGMVKVKATSKCVKVDE